MHFISKSHSQFFHCFQKSSNHKICLLFKASRHGMERIEICDRDDNKNPKIITLENCVKITHEPHPANLIHIVTKTDTLTLNALTEDDLKQWVAALQSVAFRDKTGTTGSRTATAIEEDNDLYCTSYSDDGVFNVKLISSDISLKCNLTARSYLLHLTSTDLQLKSTEDMLTTTSIVAKWPYRYIRKYGYRDGKFTFEAGRKCETGEGVFSLEHSNPQEVFRCMAAKMKTMKKLISGDSVTSLDCGEHQFNAALSMEAGSRSPLPPSPNHHSHSESELNQSGHLIRGFLSSNDSLNNVSMISTSSAGSVIAHVKQIPSKPPRKSIGCIADHHNDHNLQRLKFSKLQHFDSVSSSPESSTSSSSPGISMTTAPKPILKSPSATDSQKTILTIVTQSDANQSKDEKPPQLPIRNESKAGGAEDRDYECIETITNAWRTRGIDEVKHTERLGHIRPAPETPADDADLQDFVWQRSQSHKEITSGVAGRRSSPPLAKPITVNQSQQPVTTPTDDYDRLQFFAHKAGKSTSSDYKTIITVTPSGYKKQISKPDTSNDYEIIGECTNRTASSATSSKQNASNLNNNNNNSSIDRHALAAAASSLIRPADDSYLGYGVLRKTNGGGMSDLAMPHPLINGVPHNDHHQPSTIDHRKYNELRYAIVSKPKRV